MALTRAEAIALADTHLSRSAEVSKAEHGPFGFQAGAAKAAPRARVRLAHVEALVGLGYAQLAAVLAD